MLCDSVLHGLMAFFYGKRGIKVHTDHQPLETRDAIEVTQSAPGSWQLHQTCRRISLIARDPNSEGPIWRNHAQNEAEIEFADNYDRTLDRDWPLRVKCLAQEHNIMTSARAPSRSARSGVQRASYLATAPQ